MKRYGAGSKAQPFPLRRTTVTITQSKAKRFPVDCGESWRLLIVPDLKWGGSPCALPTRPIASIPSDGCSGTSRAIVSSDLPRSMTSKA